MRLPVWKCPSVSDAEWIYRLADQDSCMGSDCSYANLFFLRNKYDIQISYYKDFILRYYNGIGSRQGYGFPLGSGDIREILAILKKDSIQREAPFALCLITEDQKAVLESSFPHHFTYTECSDDSDYIYLQSDLSLLKGKKYHKKKNHVSQFQRKYTHYCFRKMSGTTKDDAWRIAIQWHKEHKGQSKTAQNLELHAIMDALSNFDELHLMGAILYVCNEPIAMTIASPICSQICDTHFEKAVGSYALNGAYAVINQYFASTLSEFTYINREEDIGLTGLRDAKLSYHPAILLKKYRAVWNDSERKL